MLFGGLHLKRLNTDSYETVLLGEHFINRIKNQVFNCDTFKLNMGVLEKSCYIGSRFVFMIS